MWSAPLNPFSQPTAPQKPVAKPKAKPFVGRIIVKPNVENADPCEIAPFCTRYEHARVLYDNRRWVELKKFLQHPRTRAWWVDPLVYTPDELQTGQKYLEKEYFHNATCGGLITVRLPGEGKYEPWIDIGKLTDKEVIEQLRKRAIVATNSRKDNVKKLQQSIAESTHRRDYNMTVKDKDNRNMADDVTDLQRYPLDPHGEFLVNFGKPQKPIVAGDPTSGSCWLDDEVALAFYFLARQRILRGARSKALYSELTRAEKDQVMATARRLVCEELRNWFDLVAEIVRERLKNLSSRRTDFHTVSHFASLCSLWRHQSPFSVGAHFLARCGE